MSLKEKLRQIKREEEEGIGMLEESKNLWVKDCEIMMNRIRTWIDSYVLDGIASAETYPIEITEEQVQPYTVPFHKIKFFDRGQIQICPVGTFLIGAHGRIDVTVMSSKKSPKVFMLIRNLDNEGKFNWKITIKDGHNKQEWPFSLEKFESLIEDLLEL